MSVIHKALSFSSKSWIKPARAGTRASGIVCAFDHTSKPVFLQFLKWIFSQTMNSFTLLFETKTRKILRKKRHQQESIRFCWQESIGYINLYPIKCLAHLTSEIALAKRCTCANYQTYRIYLKCRDGRVVRSLDPWSKGPGFETTFRPVTKCEERISLLSVIPGEKATGITRCGHIERKDQGCTYRLVYLFNGSMCFANKPMPTKIVSVFAYQLSMHCFD